VQKAAESGFVTDWREPAYKMTSTHLSPKEGTWRCGVLPNYFGQLFSDIQFTPPQRDKTVFVESPSRRVM